MTFTTPTTLDSVDGEADYKLDSSGTLFLVHPLITFINLVVAASCLQLAILYQSQTLVFNPPRCSVEMLSDCSDVCVLLL